MAFWVIAESADQYNSWVKNQTQSSVEPKVGSLEQQGQQAFLGSACVYCHTIQGTNASGHIGPDLTHLASRKTIGAGILPNNPGNLAGWTLNSQTVKPGNHMPPMNLNGDQVQALLAYLATLK
jgi:cytochrome c oxidase subunit 2